MNISEKKSYANLKEHSFESFSLLYKNGKLSSEKHFIIDDKARVDINVENIAKLMTKNDKHINVIRRIINTPLIEQESIIYRQDIIKDLISNPKIVDAFINIIENIEMLEKYNQQIVSNEIIKKHGPYEIQSKLLEIEEYIKCVEELSKAFNYSEEDLKSKGLQDLKKIILKEKNSDRYKALKSEIPEIIERTQYCKSVVIKIFLNKRLYPEKAAIIEFRKKKIVTNNILNNTIFKSHDNEKIGIGPIYKMPKKISFLSIEDSDKSENKQSRGLLSIFTNDEGKMKNLMDDLSNITDKVSKPIVKILNSYASENIPFLIKIKKEIIFYIGVYELLEKFKKREFKYCFPMVANMTDRKMVIDNNFNINLLDKNEIVNNEIAFNEQGRIFILTGPNSGGKTTYMESIGLTQILMQNGMFVPGDKAEISPVTDIITHYQYREDSSKKTGRLGQEAEHIKKIFNRINENVLVLLNEPFSSTSEIDSLYIAQEVIRAFRYIGVRAVYTTHLLRLGDKIDSINTYKGKSLVKSIVTKIEKVGGKHKRTYKIEEQKPMESSFAKDIINEYGISFRQLEFK